MPDTTQETCFQALPALYRQEGAAGFTYRFLGLFGDILDALEDTIYGLHHQLNPDRCDARFLPWLASWVALLLDETWDEAKQRALIRRMVSLYALRGTITGIRQFVEIYTGIKPDIIEEFHAGWRVGVQSTVGVDTKCYGTAAENAHRFSVRIKTFEEFDLARRQKVMERVRIEKPAHTQLVHVDWQASFWQVGIRSTVGVDTRVGG